MDPLSNEILIFLIFIALIAGVIDAIAGGGGLLSLPALLWVGLPPIEALATNKLQGTFGTATASCKFIYHKKIELRYLLFPIIYTFLGAALGSIMVQTLSNAWLSKIVPILLIIFSIYFLTAPNIKNVTPNLRLNNQIFGLTIGFTIGFYDGFFGPGTGSFFTAAFVILMGLNMTSAVANTKILNFTSNFASLVFFVWAGNVVWMVGLAMGVGQIIGAWIGSSLALSYGGKLIKPLLFLVCMAMSIKLLFDSYI
tara:strand:- start:123 stop:884 length:762 start_codon:yes stop_codon:yes gene_type:complete